jgi:PhnB protein
MQLNASLFFNGQCEGAFQFYEQWLGGRIEAMIPPAGTSAEQHTPPEWRDKILHARLAVNGGVPMASGAPPDRSDGAARGFPVNIGVEDPGEAERTFRAMAGQVLAGGGTVRMPIQQTFRAERFGMPVDKSGTPWTIDCEGKQ